MTEGSEKHLEIVEEITQDHLNAARALITNKDILAKLESQLKNECLKLRSFLEAAEVKFKVTQKKRESKRDLISSPCDLQKDYR